MIRRDIHPAFLGMALLGLGGFLVSPFSAQTHPPETYSITEINSIFVQGMTVKTFRDGTKALVDRSRPPTAANSQGYHHRTLYDFQAKQQYTWDLNDSSLPCGVQSFSGDWAGDPFLTSAQETEQLASQNPQESGKETINGIRTKVLKITAPGEGVATVWVEEKYGLLVKFLKVPEGGTPQVLTEVKEFSLTKPPASLFELPPACADAATTGHSETKGGKSRTVIEMVGRSERRPSDWCRQGFVWRDAFDGDHVCVPPATRTQAARDNQQAPSRTKINGYCHEGFVWREAGQDDHVCVTPDTRAQVALDNQQAASRVAAQP